MMAVLPMVQEEDRDTFDLKRFQLDIIFRCQLLSIRTNARVFPDQRASDTASSLASASALEIL